MKLTFVLFLAPARPRGRSPQAVHLPTRFDLAAWSDSDEDAMSMSEDSSTW